MNDAISILLTYGPGGVIAVLLILGILIPKSFYEREVKRGDLATLAASQNAAALLEVSTALKVNGQAIAETKTAINELRTEVAALKNELVRRGI